MQPKKSEPCMLCPETGVDLEMLVPLLMAGVLAVIAKKLSTGASTQGKILVSTLQVVSSFAVTYQIIFPPVWTNFMRSLNFLNVDLVSIFAIQCKISAGASFYTKFWATEALPLIAIIMIPIKRTYAFVVLFMLYPMISQRVFQLFDCHELDSGEAWLKADYFIDCNSDEHQIFKGIGVLTIIAYPIGIPCTFWLLLWKNKEKIRDDSHIEHLMVTERYLFLVEDYKLECWYWEALDMVRKLMLTSVLVLVEPGTLLQIGSALLVALTFYTLQIRKAPYVLYENNRLKLATDMQIILTLIISLILKASESDDSVDNLGASKEAFGYILIFVNIALPIPVAVAAFRAGVAAKKEEEGTDSDLQAAQKRWRKRRRASIDELEGLAGSELKALQSSQSGGAAEFKAFKEFKASPLWKAAAKEAIKEAAQVHKGENHGLGADPAAKSIVEMAMASRAGAVHGQHHEEGVDDDGNTVRRRLTLTGAFGKSKSGILRPNPTAAAVGSLAEKARRKKGGKKSEKDRRGTLDGAALAAALEREAAEEAEAAGGGDNLPGAANRASAPDDRVSEPLKPVPPRGAKKGGRGRTSSEVRVENEAKPSLFDQASAIPETEEVRSPEGDPPGTERARMATDEISAEEKAILAKMGAREPSGRNLGEE